MIECALTSGKILGIWPVKIPLSIKRRDSSVQYSILHSIIAHPVQKDSNTSKVLSLLFSVVVPEEEAVRNRSTGRMMILSKTWLCEVMRPIIF